NIGGSKKFSGQQLVKVARVLNGVVQVNFSQAMEPLLDIELVETERESRLRIIDLAETSGGAFEVQPDIRVNDLIARRVGNPIGLRRRLECFHDRGVNIFAAVLFKCLYIGIADLDLNLQRNAV